MRKLLLVLAVLGLAGCASQPSVDRVATLPGMSVEEFAATGNRAECERRTQAELKVSLERGQEICRCLSRSVGPALSPQQRYFTANQFRAVNSWTPKEASQAISQVLDVVEGVRNRCLAETGA